MCYGTPSIATTIGVEGLTNGHSFNGCIANSAEEFASKAVALYSDETSFIQFQKNGYHILEQEFNADNWTLKLLETISTYQRNLVQNRQRNFIGSLLQHQTMQSTKYMSKWIEAKNS